MVVKIEKLDHFGRGIAYINDKICFIDNALKDEIVEIKITKDHKKYCIGKVEYYIELSKERVNSDCNIFNECGGCNLRHLNYIEELYYKKEKLKELIKKYTNIDSSIIEDTKSFINDSYRNKAIFHVQNRKLGFYKKKTNEVIELSSCPLLKEELNNKIPLLKKLIENEKNNISEIMIRTNDLSKNKDDFMISIDGIVEDIEAIKNEIGVIYVNDKCVSNNSKLISKIGNKSFYLSKNSFFQVNSFVVDKLYDEVLNYCKEKKPKKALDLYCGTGTIGIYISDYAEEVLGIDCVKSSINDANENKKLNNCKNITFICNKVENEIDKLKGNYDLIVVDPPRAGLDKKTLMYLEKINSKYIIYISCDPVTLSRDLNELNKIYNVISIKPFNMFPRTYHVETITILERK